MRLGSKNQRKLEILRKTLNLHKKIPKENWKIFPSFSYSTGNLSFIPALENRTIFLHIFRFRGVYTHTPSRVLLILTIIYHWLATWLVDIHSASGFTPRPGKSVLLIFHFRSEINIPTSDRCALLNSLLRSEWICGWN